MTCPVKGSSIQRRIDAPRKLDHETLKAFDLSPARLAPQCMDRAHRVCGRLAGWRTGRHGAKQHRHLRRHGHGVAQLHRGGRCAAGVWCGHPRRAARRQRHRHSHLHRGHALHPGARCRHRLGRHGGSAPHDQWRRHAGVRAVPGRGPHHPLGRRHRRHQHAQQHRHRPAAVVHGVRPRAVERGGAQRALPHGQREAAFDEPVARADQYCCRCRPQRFPAPRAPCRYRRQLAAG